MLVRLVLVAVCLMFVGFMVVVMIMAAFTGMAVAVHLPEGIDE